MNNSFCSGFRPVQLDSFPTSGAASSALLVRATSRALRAASRTFAARTAFSMICWASS